MNELFSAAVELFLLGMGMVFIFLTVLIWATKLMSYLIIKSEVVPEGDVLDSLSPVSTSVPANDMRLRKIISEAIRQHRSRQ